MAAAIFLEPMASLISTMVRWPLAVLWLLAVDSGNDQLIGGKQYCAFHMVRNPRFPSVWILLFCYVQASKDTFHNGMQENKWTSTCVQTACTPSPTHLTHVGHPRSTGKRQGWRLHTHTRQMQAHHMEAPTDIHAQLPSGFHGSMGVNLFQRACRCANAL